MSWQVAYARMYLKTRKAVVNELRPYSSTTQAQCWSDPQVLMMAFSTHIPRSKNIDLRCHCKMQAMESANIC